MADSPPSVQRVKVSRILTGALASVMAQATRLTYALAIPAAIFVMMSFAPNDPEKIGGPVFLLIGILTIVLHTLVAVTTHRIIILGPNSVPTWGLTRWSQRETTFLLYIFAAALGVSFFFLLAAALPQPFGLALAAGVAIVVFSAISLIFPAVALGHSTSISTAWQQAQGNFFAMIVCVWLFPIAISLPIGALAMLPYTGPFIAIGQLIANVLTIAALSLAYAEITKGSKVWQA